MVVTALFLIPIGAAIAATDSSATSFYRGNDLVWLADRVPAAFIT